MNKVNIPKHLNNSEFIGSPKFKTENQNWGVLCPALKILF